MKLKYSILYIDDEAQNLRVFRSAFRRKYNITVLDSAQEALKVLEQESFDMLITDQRMPQMTGLDLLHEIKNTYPHMMRIILTGYSDINVIAQALNECRLYRYFTKPWSETEMNIALENAFKSYQLEKDNRALIIELTQINEQLESKVETKTYDIIKKNQTLKKLNETQRENLKVLQNQYSKNKEQASQLQEAHDSIKLKNDELERAFFIIHEKNHRIMSSIRYARRIQQTILPSATKMNRLLKNQFVFYKPKDIVSGDFYWLRKIDHGYIIAVVDCTGHGVPGAFMSLIGYTILNDIVKQKNMTVPSLILSELHTRIIAFLQQDGIKEDDRADDGMDVSMCAVYPKDSKLVYTGAKCPIYIVDNKGTLNEYRSTRYSIGMTRKVKSFEGFKNHEIHYESDNHKLYLFSDGIIDQHNSIKERFSSSRLKQMLSELASTDITEQHDAIRKQFNTFRNGAERRDDVTILGIQL